MIIKKKRFFLTEMGSFNHQIEMSFNIYSFFFSFLFFFILILCLKNLNGGHEHHDKIKLSVISNKIQQFGAKCFIYFWLSDINCAKIIHLYYSKYLFMCTLANLTITKPFSSPSDKILAGY